MTSATGARPRDGSRASSSGSGRSSTPMTSAAASIPTLPRANGPVSSGIPSRCGDGRREPGQVGADHGADRGRPHDGGQRPGPGLGRGQVGGGVPRAAVGGRAWRRAATAPDEQQRHRADRLRRRRPAPPPPRRRGSRSPVRSGGRGATSAGPAGTAITAAPSTWKVWASPACRSEPEISRGQQGRGGDPDGDADRADGLGGDERADGPPLDRRDVDAERRWSSSVAGGSSSAAHTARQTSFGGHSGARGPRPRSGRRGHR